MTLYISMLILYKFNLAKRNMKRYLIDDDFNIYQFTSINWEHPVHKHTYFELIFILKGSGIHHINGKSVPYRKGDIYFLGPEDYHHFDIGTVTEFCFLRFKESYCRFKGTIHDKRWELAVHQILLDRARLNTQFALTQRQKKAAFSLLFLLITEYNERTNPLSDVMIDNLFRTILMTIGRNALPSRKYQRTAFDEMLLHIRENLHQPDDLRIDTLAQKFHYAPNYLGIYFKKQTGESLKRYILRQKLKASESQLLYSNAGLAGIAEDLGFTDESHFCKTFRKYYGVSPGQFKKQNYRHV